MRGPLAAVALLAAMAGQLAFEAARDGMVYDEVAYIPAGFRHLTASDYRLNPETPPASKLLCAMPFLAVPLAGLPPDSGDYSWQWSFRFLHVDNASTPVLGLARIPDIVLTLVLVGALALWVRSSHGDAAAGAALALGAFHPSLLAHGHLATTDLLQAASMLFASWACFRWCLQPGFGAALGVGAALGICVSTRLTGWILAPALALVALAQLAATPAGLRGRFLGRLAVFAVVVPVTAILCIWLAYGFHYLPWPGASVAHPPHPGLGSLGRLVTVLEAWRALPEAYLEAIRFQLHDNLIEVHEAPPVWAWFYALALLVKNTPGFLVLLAAAGASLWRERRALGIGAVELHWGIPAALVFLGASAGSAQTLERYILPMYPYLILLAASRVPALLQRSSGRWLLGGALAFHVLPSLGALPSGHLTYFNSLARALRPGHRVLLDSNLDWGQDLPRLAAWMKRQGVKHVQLGYFGSDDPDRYGIGHRDLPGDHLYAPQPAKHPRRGVVAVSPNLLFNLHGLPEPGPYSDLRSRPPDDRAGVFYVYRLPGAGEANGEREEEDRGDGVQAPSPPRVPSMARHSSRMPRPVSAEVASTRSCGRPAARASSRTR